jgi:hypothetical protein
VDVSVIKARDWLLLRAAPTGDERFT